ncbi:MAG: hypothetical protein WC289_05320 [Patescibacteria group bacterium]|jgi:hypothetical protein
MTATLFRDIIRLSWQIMWRYKYLWLFGFFASLLGNGGEMQVLLNNVINISESPTALLDLQNLFSTGLLGVIFINIQDFLSGSLLQGIFILLSFIVAGIAAVWLIITSQGALYDGISKAIAGKKSDLAQGYRAGAHHFGTMLALMLLSSLVTYGLLFVFSLPIILILLVKSTETGILLYLLFAFVILIPLALVVAFVAKYAALYAVVHNQPLGRAIASGWLLFKKNILATVEMAFIIFGLGLVGAFALMIALAFLSVPFILLGFLTIALGTMAGFVLVVVLGFVVLTAAIGLYAAAFSAFRYTGWTIFFTRLVKNEGESKILRAMSQAAQYFKRPA